MSALIEEDEEGMEGLEEVEVLDGEGEVEGENDVVEMAVDDAEGEESSTESENLEDMSFLVFRNHTDSVYCAALHPTLEGVIISGGGDDRAFLWKYEEANGDIAIQRCIEFSGHTDTITSVGFNFNGSLALTGSYDGTVRVWDIENGNLLQTLDGPEDVEWAHWHSKGNAIIAGSKDGTVWMWLAHNGQCMQVFAGHDGLVSCGAFSSCGKFLCTAGDDGSVRVWLPKTGVCKQVFDGHLGHNSPVTSLEVGDDMILTGSQDGEARLYQLSGLRLLNTFIHANPSNDDAMEGESFTSVEAVGFSNESFKWVATAGMDNCLKVWDTNSGKCRVNCVHEAGVVALKWHPSLPHICTGSIDACVRVWDARNGVCFHAFTGHSNMVTFVDWKFDNSGKGTIVSVSDDTTVRLFKVEI